MHKKHCPDLLDRHVRVSNEGVAVRPTALAVLRRSDGLLCFEFSSSYSGAVRGVS